MKKKTKKSLYRIFNMDRGYGEPFALCDDCYDKWRKKLAAKNGTIMSQKMAEKALIPCNDCGI